MRTSVLAVLAAVLLAPGMAHAGAHVVIVNGNAPGIGFNDPRPATPVGGNTGTTFGEQALIAFQRAADIWGATLDSSVEIRIYATFEPLQCDPGRVVLGSAGPIWIESDFTGAQWPKTWYHIALANKQAGTDLVRPQDLPKDYPTPADDIRARFNSDLSEPRCLGPGSGWYLGLDGNEGPSQTDLVAVLLHEFAHGLGFSSVISPANGKLPNGLSDAYSRFYFDRAFGLYRDQMTDAQRVASAVDSRNVVWTGAHVTAWVPSVLARGTPLLRVTAPAAIARDYDVGAASFGPQLSDPGIQGEIVLARDESNASGLSTTDACTAITNDVAGKIALVDRGTCGFVVKVKNAQNAGAIAVLVADNAAGSPPAGLGGADPTITIPAVRITRDAGAAIKAALPGVTAALTVDPAILQGATADGYIYLNAPNPLQSGSSISHWDPLAYPNQLMEPAINADLTHEDDVPFDLTRRLFWDIGWYPDWNLDGVADCTGTEPAGGTLELGQTDTGLRNVLAKNGCSVQSLFDGCVSSPHGDTVSCVARLTTYLVNEGTITPANKGAIDALAATGL